MSAQLNQPILDGGIRSTNFFNGRLLSGEDMTTEHAAMIERACRLGKAVGSGVAYGLEVQLNKPSINATPAELATPVLTVTAGLAINRCGQPIKLTQPMDVALVRQRPAANAATIQSFSCCQPPTAGGRLTGDGVYLFTIAPAIGREGRAAVNGLSTDSAKCNSKYLVEGVQFNSIPISEPFLSAGDFNKENLPHLRNRIAYKCFGVDEWANLLQDPFGAKRQKYGVVDALLDSGDLTDCEVPLALVLWTAANGVEFVDMWAVRRRVTRHNAAGQLPVVSDRRLSEGEAMFLQFQEQIRNLLRRESNSTFFRVRDQFDYLPALGILPLADSQHERGFDRLSFFSGITLRDKTAFIEGSRFGHLIRDSLTYAPIDLANREMVWLYQVRENQQLVVRGGSAAPQPIMVFASGHVPYVGDAHFDLSRWNYSNFS